MHGAGAFEISCPPELGDSCQHIAKLTGRHAAIGAAAHLIRQVLARSTPEDCLDPVPRRRCRFADVARPRLALFFDILDARHLFDEARDLLSCERCIAAGILHHDGAVKAIRHAVIHVQRHGLVGARRRHGDDRVRAGGLGSAGEVTDLRYRHAGAPEDNGNLAVDTRQDRIEVGDPFSFAEKVELTHHDGPDDAMLGGVAAELRGSAEILRMDFEIVVVRRGQQTKNAAHPRVVRHLQESFHMLTAGWSRLRAECLRAEWRRPKVYICGRLRRWLRYCVAGIGLTAVVTAADDDIVASIEVTGNQRTRSEVILDELLFRPGQRLTPALQAESERNLRRLLYLGRATIVIQRTTPDCVHVVVQVDDLYARAASPLFAGELSEVSFGAVAVDYNLFGRGQFARLTAFDDATTGRRVTAQYGNPKLGGSRVRLSTEVGWAEEGHRLGLGLSHPFHTLATRHAYGVSLSSVATRTRLYGGGDLAALYDSRIEAANAWYVLSYGQHTKVRPGVQLVMSQQTFAAAGPFTYAPDDRRRVLPAAVLTIWQPRYTTRRYLMLLGPQEDFQTGSFATLSAGLSSTALGSDDTYAFAALTLGPAAELGDDWLLLSTWRTGLRWYSGPGWFNGSYSNVVSSASARLLGRLLHWPGRPTLDVRAQLDALWRPEDVGSQFLLGGDSGLRGHRPRRFDGDRRLTTGIELRPVFVQQPHWVLGGALFADAGGAWASTHPKLHAGVGAGLRLGLPSVYDTPVIRLDLARGLGGGLWQLSFGLGQYF